MEYCIVYISSAFLSEEELNLIMYQSQKKNRALGITGVLLYFNGSIIEVLEGPEEKVEALYEVISQDSRHTQLIQLYANPIERRSFPNWFMGYKTISAIELEHLKDVVPFTENSVSETLNEENVILAMVKLFYKNNYWN
ncbi:BLUF domain-containing protein [Spirosoma flavum]|uniref:BLUF domain-containing protein n=1 Tax=Spirosoma flavum TaxID=2048557 RepID=A0ABW6AH50_9BACT